MTIDALLITWLVTYVAPAALFGQLALVWIKEKKHWYERNVTITHAALLVSSVLSQYAIYARGLRFPWYPGPLSVLAFVVSAVFALLYLSRLGRWLGLWYAASVLVQQAAMLSIAFLLLPAFPVWAVILLVVPIFVAAHFISLRHWKLKLLLISAWGVATILLFVLTHNIWLIAALHTALGAFFIQKRILYLGISTVH
jgi:hypothetical protein